MRNIKPSTLVAIGFSWPFIAGFLLILSMVIPMAFPALRENWAMFVTAFLVYPPPVLLFVFALALSRAQKDAFAKGRVYKYLTASQICLMCSVVLITVALALSVFDLEEISNLLLAPSIMFSGVAVVLCFVGLLQRGLKKKARRPKPAPRAPKTDNSAESAPPRQEEAEQNIRIVCCACGTEHPRDEMIMVDDDYFCRDCFREKYAEEFYPEE